MVAACARGRKKRVELLLLSSSSFFAAGVKGKRKTKYYSEGREGEGRLLVRGITDELSDIIGKKEKVQEAPPPSPRHPEMFPGSTSHFNHPLIMVLRSETYQIQF